MEVLQDINMTESSHTPGPSGLSPIAATCTLIKEEEDLSEYQEGGDDEDLGWIEEEDSDGENTGERHPLAEGLEKNRRDSHSLLTAETILTTEAASRPRSTLERSDFLTNGSCSKSSQRGSDLHFEEKAPGARMTIGTMEKPHPSRNFGNGDVHCSEGDPGNPSLYYSDECNRFLSDCKCNVRHARGYAEDVESSDIQRDLDVGKEYSKERTVDRERGRRDTKNIMQEEREGRSVIEDDDSEVRTRLGLRLSRSVPARLQNGAETCVDSKSEDENEEVERRKQLALKENDQIDICDGDGSSRAITSKPKVNKKRCRVRMGRPLKDKSRLQCPQCGRGFKRKPDLERHLRVHSGEKPFACELCDMRFTRNFGLSCHMRTHAGLKIHTCITCGKSYSRRYDLVKHERAVHTGELNHVCGECDKRFVTAQLLRVHKRTHTNSQPYLCQECGHRSNHRSDLKKHMRVHTNERPYCCPICKRSFLQSSCLASHMSHTHRK